MSVLNENVGIKIKEVIKMSWDVGAVSVAPRPYHALVFRVNGEATFSHGIETAKTGIGEVFYMPANYEYNAVYDGKNEIIAIHFESELDSKMENYTLENVRIISELFQRIYGIWNKKEEGYYYASLAVMCDVLQNISIQQDNFPYKTATTFKKAVEYMEDNYTSCDFSVAEMVSRAYMSNTYFRKMFVARFGTTPVRYLASKRLSHAERLLSTGEYSVEEVARMSGFDDAKYFSRAVKKEYGVPPSRLYRHSGK